MLYFPYILSFTAFWNAEAGFVTADNTNYVKYYRYFFVEISYRSIRVLTIQPLLSKKIFFYACGSRYSPILKN